VTHFRPFRNGDPPALAALWSRGVPTYGTARPVNAHEFDARVSNQPYFDPDGLIVAVRDGAVVGFVHAGFGPDQAPSRPLHLDPALGTIAALVVEPGPEDAELERELVARAERYLRRRGAEVLYAGGQAPVNPFYWGFYGGSEFAGILASHATFLRAVGRAGYEPVSTTVLLEADLSAPDGREPRAPLIRRMARIEVIEDATPLTWWDALAIGESHLTLFRLLSKQDDRVLARASTWDMPWFGRFDGLARIGLVDMEVPADQRRHGFGRHLVAEIVRQARAALIQAIAVQTSETNVPALALYESLGFQRVETATLYRLPAHLVSRSE
jgi:ribosomal protein S18 acetylase RimI-like enzyme